MSHWKGAPRDPQVGQAELPSPERVRGTCRDSRCCKVATSFHGNIPFGEENTHKSPDPASHPDVGGQTQALLHTQRTFFLFFKDGQHRRCGSSATPLRLPCSSRDRAAPVWDCKGCRGNQESLNPAAPCPRWVLGMAKGPSLHCAPPSTPAPSSLSTSLVCAIVKLPEKNSNQRRCGRKASGGWGGVQTMGFRNTHPTHS